MKVCHVTTMHSSDDIRIFQKEIMSLSKFFETHFAVSNIKENQDFSNVKVHKIRKRKGKVGRLIQSYFDAKKVLKKIDADIYHLHDPELIFVGLYLKRKKKKVIYDVHEDLPRTIISRPWVPKLLKKPLSHLVECIENYCSKRFDLLICATPHINQRFANLGIKSITVNNYPLKNELVFDEKVHNGVKKKDQVVYIGVLSEIRGITQILEASKKIHEKGKIILAGPDKDKLTAKIDKNKNIEYLGKVSRIKVKELLNESKAGLVLFLPEPNHINSQPNKMFEYMSAGLPVICSNFELWRNIVEKYNCGICIDPKNTDEIADAITYILLNSDKAKIMGENGRRAVVEVFNWESESEKLISAYYKLSARMSE